MRGQERRWRAKASIAAKRRAVLGGLDNALASTGPLVTAEERPVAPVAEAEPGALGSMGPSVAVSAHQLEVLGAIIQPVVVFVVDDLARVQPATEHGAHHQPLEVEVASAPLDADVARSGERAAIRRVVPAREWRLWPAGEVRFQARAQSGEGGRPRRRGARRRPQ